jgi:hypothetical protein
MNANELADELKERIKWAIIPDFWSLKINEAATMLRQQQEQIENLKQWERRHLDVIHSLERQLKIVTEANTRSRP